MANVPPQPWTAARVTPDHQHAFHELALVVEGACVWRLGRRRRVVLGAGDFLLLPPRRVHREEVPAGRSARLMWLGFSLCGGAEEFEPLLDRAWAAGAWAGDLAALIEMLYREHQRPEAPAAAARVEGLLGAVCATLQRVAAGGAEAAGPEGGRHGAGMRAAAHTLRRNLHEPPRVAELAGQHGLTPGRFSTVFAAEHGVSPRAFLQGARIEEAQRRLRETDEGVKEIAAACGYVDAPHFCRAFKVATGCTPRAWRMVARSGTRATTREL
jgi:AraC-like DNA-binding protein